MFLLVKSTLIQYPLQISRFQGCSTLVRRFTRSIRRDAKNDAVPFSKHEFQRRMPTLSRFTRACTEEMGHVEQITNTINILLERASTNSKNPTGATVIYRLQIS